MRSRYVVVVALGLGFAASAQELQLDTNALNQVFGVVQDWALQNLDAEALASLPPVDRDAVERFLGEYQKSLRGDQVMELAPLRNAARTVLPLLEAHEETEPYALWLRSRLDYFDVADKLKRLAPPAPRIRGETPAPLSNPSAVAERKAWEEKMHRSSWPKVAAELVPKLKKVFLAEKVPAELVWLAEVESGFNPRARSPVGAAGLFQLMPATAKQFKLRSFPFDQRYQPEPSAHAAAQYLGYLRRKFGDWPLALAAYNAGEGTVQRSLEKHKARSFDRIATFLPAETQMFVPRMDATLQEREGMTLAKLPATGGSAKR